MKAIAQQFLNFEDPALGFAERRTFLRKIAFCILTFNFLRSFPPTPIFLSYPAPPNFYLLSPPLFIPTSPRPQRPIIFRPFSLSLITIHLHQTLINIYKTITYVTISHLYKCRECSTNQTFYAKQTQCQNR